MDYKATILQLIESDINHYKVILENMDDAIVTINQEGIIEFSNRASQHLFGYHSKEVIGKPAGMLLPDITDQKDNFLDRCLKMAEQRPADFNKEVEAIHKDGRKFRIFLTISHHRIDDRVYFTAFIRDSSKLSAYESELKKLSLVASKTINGVVITDKEKHIEWVNEGFTRLTGYSYEEAIGKHPGKLLQGPDSDLSVIERIREQLKKTFSFTETLLNYKKSGETYWTSLYITPILDDQGNIDRFFAIQTDITEVVRVQKALEESNNYLKAAKKSAEESDKAKDIFLANTSHELRTPMNIIIGMLEVLKRTELTQKQKEFLRIIENTSENLLYLLNDILDISKIESGKLEFEVTGFRLCEIISSIIETGTSLANKKKIGFSFKCVEECTDLIVLGDPVRLSQVLYNLTTNAIKFTEKGEVILQVSLVQQTDADILMRFEVRDTGIGIPKEQQERIFQDFTQADAGTTRKYGGTGLGLSISRKLVELMGGKLEVESQEGQGSNFFFTITLKKGTSDDLPEIVRKKLSMGLEREISNLRILVAEDNQFNAMILKEILTSSNCIVEIVSNGEQAIQKLSENEFDIVLMDIQMPVMDGVETTQYIRNNLPQPKSKVPIVALTAHAKKGDKEKYLHYGMNAYISKPFKPHELKSVIVETLNIHHKTSEYIAPEESEVPAYNLTQLRELADGDKEFIQKAIQTFIDNTKEAMAEFDKQIEGGDTGKISRTAHRIKTGFSILGLDNLYQLLNTLEEQTQSEHDMEKIMVQVRELQKQVRPLLKTLQKEISV